MNIYAKAGASVILWCPRNGYERDQVQIKELKMTRLKTYTVERTEVGQCHTALFLKEFPGRVFNTVNFGQVIPSTTEGERP